MDYKIYFVPTPIGNLEDITLRSLNVLKNVDIIACEDTRESKKLLNFYQINKALTSYHKFNEVQKSKEIIEKAKAGLTYAIISDQGMPGISDPGHILIKECIKNKISYTVLPGASSLITALIASGMDNDKFSYYGFVPKKSSDKKNYYEVLEKEDKTSIIFDSPHNLANTINDFKKIFPNRKLAIIREISKKFEEYLILDIKDIEVDNLTLRGEFVLILEGNKNKKDIKIEDYKDKIKQMKNSGKSTKDIVKELKKLTNLSKNEIYQYIIDN